MFGCNGNQKAKFAKKYSKIISSEAIREMKLSRKCSLASTNLAFLVDVALMLTSLWQTKMKTVLSDENHVPPNQQLVQEIICSFTVFIVW